MAVITEDPKTGEATVYAWVTLDDGREVQVASPINEDVIPLALAGPVDERVTLSRSHRWWAGPSDWEFQRGPGLLRRIW